jgi:ribosome-associated toxin RatA of RatAB toxin-antitoxin module
MAEATKTEIYHVTPQKFYEAIINYKAYPEFVSGVSSVKLIESTPNGAIVEYSINIIKNITYTLKLSHEENKKVSWSLVSGDMMKVNNGSWTLKDMGEGKTEVTYSLQVEFKGFLPGLSLIEKTLVNTNLPMTMKAFAERAAKI